MMRSHPPSVDDADRCVVMIDELWGMWCFGYFNQEFYKSGLEG
jgi:hypothetical protein